MGRGEFFSQFGFINLPIGVQLDQGYMMTGFHLNMVNAKITGFKNSGWMNISVLMAVISMTREQ